MGYASLICITTLFLSTFSCGAHHKKDAEKHTADSVNNAMTLHDTIPVPPPPPPGLPPNTIRVSGEILKVDTMDDNEAQVKFKVITMLKMGSSATLVSQDDTLLIKSPALSDSLKVGKKIICILKHRQILAQFKKTAPQWILVGIENDQTKY